MSDLDTGEMLVALAYATEALTEIQALAAEALPYTALTRAHHDPLLDILNAAQRGLRAKEASCTPTRS